MKTTRKLLACLLVVVMLASMFCVGASAANITINNKADGTYTVYKIFDVEVNSITHAFQYTIETSSPWYAFVSTGGAGSAYVTLTQKDTDTYYVEWATGSVTTFANAVKAAGITATKTTDTGSLTLDDGYYVMTSPASDIPFAFSVIEDAIKVGSSGYFTTNTITEKMGLPSINKYVEEDLTDLDTTTAESATASIGDTVYFKVVVAAEKNAHNYKIVDTLSAGLFAPAVGDVKVSYTDSSTHTTSDITANAAVTVVGQVITVDLTDYCATNSATINASDEFVVTYSAVLDDDAVIAGAGNPNTVKLAYGSVSITDTTKSDIAKVYTYSFDLKKIDKKTSNVIAGAQFTISDGSGTITFTQVGDTYRVDPDGTTTTVTAGQVTIAGLGNGTYTITETAAPAGYIKANTPATITITDANGAEVVVENEPGSALPETGGIGTTVFYAVGGCLVLAALVVLLMKKRTIAD